jgi:hypothetical protein
MLALILGMVLAWVTGFSPGLGHAPGITNPASVPTAAGDHSQAVDAVTNAGKPDAVTATDETTNPVDEGKPETVPPVDTGQPETVPPVQTGQPETVPPVDTSNAPAEIDLSGVPANDDANVPDTVGAADQAELPDQAGGVEGGLPADEAAPTGACAANVQGQDAADCTGQ